MKRNFLSATVCDHDIYVLLNISIEGVDEEDVIYDDEHWHDYCLVCHLCSCRLSGTSFVIRDDNFLCSECYQKTDDKRCKTCGKGFEPGAKRYLVFFFLFLFVNFLFFFSPTIPLILQLVQLFRGQFLGHLRCSCV